MMCVVVRLISVKRSIRYRRVLVTMGGFNCVRMKLATILLTVIVFVIVAAGGMAVMGVMPMVVVVMEILGKMMM